MTVIRLSILLMYFLIIVSCSDKKAIDMEKYIDDKVWISFVDIDDETPDQVYYNSSNKIYYIYQATEIKGEDENYLNTVYSPWKKYKGTPHTNPYPTAEESLYKKKYEGWMELKYYRIKNNKILLQRLDDINGSSVDTVLVEKGKDTIIGIFEYNTLKTTFIDNVTGKPWERTWLNRLE